MAGGGGGAAATSDEISALSPSLRVMLLCCFCCCSLLCSWSLLVLLPARAHCPVPSSQPSSALRLAPCEVWGMGGRIRRHLDFLTLQSVLLPCQSGPPDGWAGLLDSRLEPALSCWSLFLAPPLFGSVPLCQSKQACGQRGRAVLGAAFCLVARPSAALLDRSSRRLAGWTAHTSTD